MRCGWFGAGRRPRPAEPAGPSRPRCAGRTRPRRCSDPGHDVLVVPGGHGAPGVGNHQDPVDAEQVHAEDAADQGRGGDPAARRTDDLGVADPQPDHLQWLDPGVHAGDHGHPGVGDPVEPCWENWSGRRRCWSAGRRSWRVAAAIGHGRLGRYVMRGPVTHELVSRRPGPTAAIGWPAGVPRPVAATLGRGQVDRAPLAAAAPAGAGPAQASSRVSSPFRKRWQRTPPVARPLPGYSASGVTLTAPASVPGSAFEVPETVTDLAVARWRGTARSTPPGHRLPA